MLKQFRSGFQAGADIACIDAAIKYDFPYTGWVPKGRRTENGPLSEIYKAVEMPSTGYPARTKKNVADSDGTVILTHGPLTGGSSLTAKYAKEQGRPYLHINLNKSSIDIAVRDLLAWIEVNDVQVLNVAGRSASKDPNIYEAVFTIMQRVIEISIGVDTAL